MRKTIVVAVREYQAAVRTKAFIITLVAMPILMGGAIVAQILLKDKVDTKDRKVAVVDYSGVVYDAIDAAARNRNATEIFDTDGDGRKQSKPGFLVEKAEATSDDVDQVRFDLS